MRRSKIVLGSTCESLRLWVSAWSEKYETHIFRCMFVVEAPAYLFRGND